MAGALKINSLQLGDSSTPSHNFVLRTNVDGTVTLARGNIGETTQDILTIGADGTVKLPASIVPAFNARADGTQSINSGAVAKVLYATELDDTNNNFATSRFTATIAGYYLFNANSAWIGGGTTGEVWIGMYKNGVAQAYPTDVASAIYAIPAPYFMHLAIGDYAEVYVYQGTGAAKSIHASSYFQGILLART